VGRVTPASDAGCAAAAVPESGRIAAAADVIRAAADVPDEGRAAVVPADMHVGAD
jgi:hypothetical protein